VLGEELPILFNSAHSRPNFLLSKFLPTADEYHLLSPLRSLLLPSEKIPLNAVTETIHTATQASISIQKYCQPVRMLLRAVMRERRVLEMRIMMMLRQRKVAMMSFWRRESRIW